MLTDGSVEFMGMDADGWCDGSVFSMKLEAKSLKHRMEEESDDV